MNKLAIIGIVAVVMLAVGVFATTQPADARSIDRNNVNVCRNCQSAQNSGDDSLNTNGGIVQIR